MKERQLQFRESRRDLESYLAEINKNRHPLFLLLDRLHNPRNIAALFRLADAARLAGIYTFKMESLEGNSKLKRIARSTTSHVPYIELQDLEQVRTLRENFPLVALEITNASVPVHQYSVSGPLILIIGNERSGVSDELLNLAGHSVHIPMMGVNTSMNVAVATGIAVYRLLESMGKLG